MTLGTITGSSVTHDSQYIVTAQFAITALEPVGWKDAAIVFTPPGGSTLTYSKTAAFQVTAGSGVAASFTGTPTSGTAPLTVSFTDASAGAINNRLWDFGDGTTSTANNPSHTYTNTGTYTASLAVFATAGSNTLSRAGYITVTLHNAVSPAPDNHRAGCEKALREIGVAVGKEGSHVRGVADDVAPDGGGGDADGPGGPIQDRDERRVHATNVNLFLNR